MATKITLPATLDLVVLPPAMAAVPFNVRLIPECDGMLDVMEWVVRVGILCKLQGIPLELVLLLVPHDERQYKAPLGLVPLMTVHQNNSGKMRPMLDY